MLQRRGSVLHEHGAILGFLRVLQEADNGLGGGKQGCSAENAIAAVEEVDALFFQADDEAEREASVQKRPGGDEGVGQAAGVCFFLKRVLDSDLVLEDRESARFLRLSARPELGRNETLDMGFGSGFHQPKLRGDRVPGKNRDDGILAFESAGEGIEGVLVDGDHVHGGGKIVIAALASQNCFLEPQRPGVIREWLGRDRPWPAFTSFFGLSEIETVRWNWEAFLTPAIATLVMLLIF